MLPRIDRYELTNEIGHGGMATVYRARDTRLDRWVAIKVMHPHLRGTEQARARFSREARAVARLRHPAILEIYDYSGNDSNDAYIATELLTGPTLRVFVDGIGDIPPEIAACIGAELAAALAAAHAQGIVHRDVKPENVLLHEARTVKLTDFGIADMLDPSMSAMTATGQLLGSPAHMAPEQVESGDADARSDVFALGTILYWLGTGTLPFSGKNPHQVLKRVVDCQPAEPLSLRPALGKPLRDVICRCLAKDPNARYQTAEELARALTEVLAKVGIPDPAAALRAYLRDPRTEAPLIRDRVLSVLLEDARGCVTRRERMRALERLDHVLSLDDGNVEALKLIAQLDRAARRRWLTRASIAVAALAALVVLWIAAPRSGAVSAGEPRDLATLTATDRPLTRLDAGASATTVPTAAQAEHATLERVSASGADAALARRSEPPRDDTSPALDDESARAARHAARVRDTKPRTVVFDPTPANVTIAVDGAEPRPFGPSFRLIELAPGPHRFRFEGAHDCCKPQVLDVVVPAGTGEFVVRAKLELRDARLYVVSNVPANVIVDDELVKGRTRTLLSVPIKQRLVERHRISVTAPGYEPYTLYVDMRAGEVAQPEVSLQPRASP